MSMEIKTKEEIGMIRKLDDLGRIVIPKSFRKTLNMGEGDNLNMRIEGNSVIISTMKDKCPLCGCDLPEETENVKFLLCERCIIEIKAL